MILLYYIILLLTTGGSLVDWSGNWTCVIDHGVREWSYQHQPESQTSNNPPNVKIILPKEGAELTKKGSIRYLVHVSDMEDGSTDYGEILPNEVLLELSCWPSMEAATDYRKKVSGSTKDLQDLTLINRSGCFNCHEDKSRLMGPSFEDIANRYSGDAITIGTLTENIITGSTGIWGDVVMPPNPELPQTEVLQAVKYILKQGGNKNSRIYTGYEGAIRPIKKPHNDATCVYVLTSFYTDKGVNGIPGTALRGQHSILLR